MPMTTRTGPVNTAPQPLPAKKTVPLVALDLGNFQCTAFDGTEPTTIRSLFIELKPGQTALKTSPSSPLISLDGRRYHVGPKATEYSKYRAVDSSDKPDVAEVFFAATMPLIDCDEIDLVILHHSYAQVEQALKERLTGLFSFTRNGKVHAVNIRSVAVIDEAIGAWHLLKRPKGLTLGIDIGAGTYLIRVWNREGEVIAGETADKDGVYRLAVALAQDARLKGPLRDLRITSPLPSVILDGFANGSHQYGLTGVGWRDWWQEYRRDWFNAIVNEALSKYQPYLGDVTNLLFTGGGVLLADGLIKEDGMVVVPKPPQLASVIGAHRFMAGGDR